MIRDKQRFLVTFGAWVVCVTGLLCVTGCAALDSRDFSPTEVSVDSMTPMVVTPLVMGSVPVSVTAVLDSSIAALPAATSTPVLEVPHEEALPVSPESFDYTVQAGDTLLGLALQYEVPMAAIQLQNQLGDTTTLQAGQVLHIPAPAEWEGHSPFWVVHLVAAGETLSGIALTYALDLMTLSAINGIPDSNWLTVGQPLILPLDGPAELLAQVPVSEPTPVPPATPTLAVLPATAEAVLPPELPDPTSVSPPPASSSDDVTAWSLEVFELINAVRATHGLSPYAYNETLAQAARLHAADCQQRGFCNHVGSDGSTVKVRVVRAGYDAVGAAECIVYSTSPQAAVDWWMDEVPPNDWHRRTLLNTWVTEIGIAVVPNGQGSYYFIADFGRPGGM